MNILEAALYGYWMFSMGVLFVAIVHSIADLRIVSPREFLGMLGGSLVLPIMIIGVIVLSLAQKIKDMRKK